MKKFFVLVAAVFSCLLFNSSTQAQTLTLDLSQITVTNLSPAPVAVAEAKVKWSALWVRQQLASGVVQPKCCKAWDKLTSKQKRGLQHMHGQLGPMASVPVLTRTDPLTPQNPHCKGKPCFPKGHKMVQDGKADACDNSGTNKCGRGCEDHGGSISGCSRNCCEAECGCGECP